MVRSGEETPNGYSYSSLGRGHTHPGRVGHEAEGERDVTVVPRRRNGQGRANRLRTGQFEEFRRISVCSCGTDTAAGCLVLGPGALKVGVQ